MAKFTWHALCARLTSMTEAEVKALLDEEINEHKRPAMARRLHQRLSTLRAARERVEIMKRIAK